MPYADEHYRAPLLWLLAPYLAGLALAAAGTGMTNAVALGVAAILGGAALTVSFSRRRHGAVLWSVLLALATVLAGVARMQHALDPAGATARWAGMPAREVMLEVEITRRFAPGEDPSRMSCMGTVLRAASPLQDLAGQRVFFGLDAATVDGGDLLPSGRVRVRGILMRLDPHAVRRTSFEGFLVTAGVGFLLERAEVQAVIRAPGTIATFLQRTNARFEAILRHRLPAGHPATAVYVAMFLGRKAELSAEQKENFLRSGTMHLFAISGLHIAVIAGCLESVLTALRLPRRAGAVLGLAALWVFVEATGGTPSAERAFFMVAFIWAGSVLRRPANPLASLVASALCVLVVDPLALLSASFQLSYAVVAALLLYGVPLRHRWHAAWRPWRDLPEADWGFWRTQVFRRVRGALTLAAISCAATMVSTPMSIAYFELASPGAVLSNLALVPVTTGAIAAGFASLVGGLAGATWFSAVFNHAGAMILAFVDAGAEWAAALPGMYFGARFGAGWMAPAIVLTLLTVLVAGYARGWPRFPGRWWTPPAVLVGLVALLVTPGSRDEQSAPMKSAYELAMERLKKSDPASGPELTAEQKARLAEIDRVYQGKIAEREIFLRQRLNEAQAAGQTEEVEKIRQQMTSERARLEEDREDEKNKVRRGTGR